MQPEGPLAKVISIHAPRVGSDGRPSAAGLRTQEFQSTLPVWGATLQPAHYQAGRSISIHAPRVGSDRAAVRASAEVWIFQSTLPVWGATWP